MKPIINFYQLSKSPIEEALPVIMEKTLSVGARSVVVCNNKNLLKNLDTALWSVGGTRFIPHGSFEDDEFIEQQPIYLTTENENPNNANYLINIGVLQDDFYKNFERSFIIFNEADTQEITAARSLWKSLKSKENLTLKFFKQNEKGGWEEAA